MPEVELEPTTLGLGLVATLPSVHTSQQAAFIIWLKIGFLFHFNVLRHHIPVKMAFEKKIKTHLTTTQTQSTDSYRLDLLITNMCMVCCFDRYFRLKYRLKLKFNNKMHIWSHSFHQHISKLKVWQVYRFFRLSILLVFSTSFTCGQSCL